MVNIPLNLKLKKKIQKEIAYAQDFIVEELYNFFPEAVVHGGTAIWRCYNGNRFSEDINVYLKKDEKVLNNFFRGLEKKGFIILKKRIKENSVYSELEFNEVRVRFEVTFQTKKYILKRYETSESFFINIYTLSPEDLIIEKINTYVKRRKIRDLYDVFFLLNFVEKNKDVRRGLKNLIKNFEEPVDEGNLNAIIITGIIPNLEQLLREIRKWVK